MELILVNVPDLSTFLNTGYYNQAFGLQAEDTFE
jgi:hypothetical protein